MDSLSPFCCRRADCPDLYCPGHPKVALHPAVRAISVNGAPAQIVRARHSFDAVLTALETSGDPNGRIEAGAKAEVWHRRNDRRALELQVQANPNQWGIA